MIPKLSPTQRIAAVVGAVVALMAVAFVSGWFSLDNENVVILQTLIGGAIIYAIREYVGSLKQEVQLNTGISTEARDNTAELMQYVQENQRLRLEVELYRKVYNRIRDTPECDECATIIADEFKVTRISAS